MPTRKKTPKKPTTQPKADLVVHYQPALSRALEQLRAVVNAALDFADTAAEKLTKALQTRS